MATALRTWLWNALIGGLFDNDVARANAAAELADVQARLLLVDDLDRRLGRRSAMPVETTAATPQRTAA